MRILGMKDWSLARVVIESAYDMNKIGGGEGKQEIIIFGQTWRGLSGSLPTRSFVPLAR